MKIVIAGSRDYCNYAEARRFIGEVIAGIETKEEICVLSGGCRGADMIGERYALEHGYRIVRYPAKWDLYGKKAGPLRNKEMVTDCDIVICFWDGESRGTRSLIGFARDANVPVYIKRIDQQ